MPRFSRNFRIWSAMALILVACLLAGSAQAQVRGAGASGRLTRRSIGDSRIMEAGGVWGQFPPGREGSVSGLIRSDRFF